MNKGRFTSDAIGSAIVAYTGMGSDRTPGAHADAVLALAPGPTGQHLLNEVRLIVDLSDTVTADWSDAVDGRLFPVFAERMTALRPDLSDSALRALSWRWAYVAFY